MKKKNELTYSKVYEVVQNCLYEMVIKTLLFIDVTLYMLFSNGLFLDYLTKTFGVGFVSFVSSLFVVPLNLFMCAVSYHFALFLIEEELNLRGDKNATKKIYRKIKGRRF